MVDTTIIENALSDIGNLSLVIFGFSVTLFTVIYSFIYMKKEQAVEYGEIIKKGNPSPFVLTRHRNAINVIYDYKKCNKHLIFIIFMNITMYLSSIFLTYYIIQEKELCTIILGGISIIMILYIITILIITIKDYRYITKI